MNDPLGANISWTALTAGSTVNSPDQQTTEAVISTGSGVYLFEYALGTAGCGIFRDTVAITIKSNIQVNAGSDMNICAANFPYSVTMDGSISSRTGSVPALWTQLSGPAAAVIIDPADSHTAIENLQAGNYQFEYKMIPANECEYIADTVNIRISAEPSDAIAGPDQSVCNASLQTLVYLSANTALVGIGHWQIMSSPPGSPSPVFSDEASPNSTITNLTQGIYHLRWIITNGIACTAKTDDMEIDISAIASAGNNIASCSATTIQLTGNPNTYGTWTLVSGWPGVSINANSGNTAIVSGLGTTTAATVYTFRYSLPDVGACRNSFDDLVFTNYPLPSAANAGGDKLLCFDETTVTLTGNIPASGRGNWLWQSGPNNPVAGTASYNSNDTILNNILPGIYVYQYRVSTNAVCPVSTENIQIIKQAKANAQADFRVCNLPAINLNANVPLMGQGTWSYISGPLAPGAIVFSNTQNPASAVTGLVPGVYVFRWSIDPIATCTENHDDIQVTIDPPVPAANAGNNQQFCQGTVSPFNIGSTANAGVTYNWTPFAMLSSSGIAQPVFQGVNNPGNYVYTLRASIGSCESYSTVNINVRPTPFANIEVLSGSCIAGFMASSPGNGVNNPVYNWNFGSGVNPSTASGPGPHEVIFNNSGPRTITLEIVSADACTGNTSLVFQPLCVLPVKLISFDAIWKTDYTDIHWNVEDAINLDHFELERSYDGISFGFLNKTVYINNLQHYQYSDMSVSTAANTEVFYRLKMIDRDNAFAYSAIKKIKLPKEENTGINVWPNPFTDKLMIHYNAGHLPQSLVIKFFNSIGEVVLKRVIITEQRTGLIEIGNLGMLPAGFYNLQIIADNKIISNHKILKTVQ